DIRSTGNFTKRFAWGTLNAGLNRRQKITDGSGDMTLPTLTLSPNPIDIGRTITWSPGMTFTNALTFKTPLSTLFVPGVEPGKVDSTKQTGDTRTSTFHLDTPFRIGGFKLPLTIDVNDRSSTGRSSATFKVPNLDTPDDPNDSLTVTQIHNGDFST